MTPTQRHALHALCAVAMLFALPGCDVKVSKYRITSHVPADTAGFSSALFQSTATRLQDGHRIEFINNGAVFDRLEDEIQRAEQSINVVVFIWRQGEPSRRLAKAISARARAGVRCRIIVDDVGSAGFSDTRAQLRAAGCDVRPFRPLTEAITLDRNHRKLFIFDGKRALTGGVGIDKVWLGDGRHADQWRDSNVLVTGPAVQLMQQAFAENWQEVDGPILPPEDFPEPDRSGSTQATFVSSTGSPHLTRAERLTQLAIAAATTRLWITNPYFVPSPGISELLLQKKREGVDVRILVSGDPSDNPEVLREQRATYPALLKAAIRIWEYQPAMLHAKTIAIDDQLAVVGSINFDHLSLDRMEEGALVISDPALVTQLAATWQEDIDFSREILTP